MRTGTEVMMQENSLRMSTHFRKHILDKLDPAQAEDYKEFLKWRWVDNVDISALKRLMKEVQQ